MSFTTAPPAIAEYVRRCEEHLRDLPPETIAQLRRDIEEIVSEVCGELDGPPHELVGPPLRFVTELRAAAGVSPPPAAGDHAEVRAGRGVRDRLRAVWSHPASRWARGLVPELRPAWWVARGLVLAVLLGRLTGAGQRPSWLLGVVPYWPVLGSDILGLAAVAGGVYLSVEAGRRLLPRRARAVRAVASIVAVWFAFVLVTEMKELARPHVQYSPQHIHYPDVSRPPGAGQGLGGFGLVQIGSEVGGTQTSVVDVHSARRLVDELLATTPAAGIFIEHAGSRVNPGTRMAIEQALQNLAAQGLLNE